VRTCRRITTILRITGLALLLLGQACSRQTEVDPQTGVLDTARRAFLDGRYPAAEETYQYYLQAFPKGRFRLEAWQRLADISQDVRDSPARAAGLLKAALLEFGNDPEAAPELLGRAAELRQNLKEYDKATSHYRELIAFPGISLPRLAMGCQQLGQVRVLAHDPAGALAVYESCRQSLPSGDARARLDLARAALLLRLDRGPEAEAFLREVYEKKETSPAVRAEAGFSLAQQYEARNDKAKARALYEAIRDTFPNPLVIDQRLRYLPNER